MSKSLEKFEIIKESINTFDDAEFISIISENELLLKNINTQEEFKIKYFYNEDNKTVFFDTINADRTKANLNIENSLVRKKDVLKKSIINYLESEENDIEDLKETIESLTFKNPLKIMFKESAEDIEIKESESVFYEAADNITKKTIDNLNNNISSKVAFYSQLKDSFISLGKIFNEDEIIKDIFLSPKKIIELYSEKNSLISDLISASKKINDKINLIAEESKMQDDEIKTIFENIDFSDDASLTVSLTKNLVNYKRQTGKNIAINEFIKNAKKIMLEQKEIQDSFVLNNIKNFDEKIAKIINIIVEEITPNENTPGISKLSLLKFNTGFFQPQDVKVLKNDLDTVMRRVNDVSRDDMMEIQGMRNTVEFMDRTGSINDEVVHKIVCSFNDKYGNKDAIEAQKKYSDFDLEKFRSGVLSTFKTTGSIATSNGNTTNIAPKEEPKDTEIEITASAVKDAAEESFEEGELSQVELAIKKAKKKLAALKG